MQFVALIPNMVFVCHFEEILWAKTLKNLETPGFLKTQIFGAIEFILCVHGA